MANTKSAIKAAKVAEKKRQRNQAVRTRVKTATTKAKKLVAQGGEASQTAVVEAIRVLDKAAQKGVLHPRNAARHKSRLMKKVNATIRGPATEAAS